MTSLWVGLRLKYNIDTPKLLEPSLVAYALKSCSEILFFQIFGYNAFFLIILLPVSESKCNFLNVFKCYRKTRFHILPGQALTISSYKFSYFFFAYSGWLKGDQAIITINHNFSSLTE